jgi:hypothetical protein
MGESYHSGRLRRKLRGNPGICGRAVAAWQPVIGCKMDYFRRAGL